ncbi:hypothetical protein FGO68_gene579 [Halteria grandinella]|uniref:Uncharacterized protein n=1 Tax=Halteria grandinella TaxID=5974 RepID=A0A8J8NRP5_HALGN|nr:hypothetical protein FGO68_gene579 [Halteria grandinella]
MSTFEIPQELETETAELYDLAKTMKSLQTFNLLDNDIRDLELPPSLQNFIYLENQICTTDLQSLLDKYPHIKEVTVIIPTDRQKVVQLLQNYKEVKFNFTKNRFMNPIVKIDDAFYQMYPQKKEEQSQ